MVIVEFAGEGHNDALMIVFVLLSILLTIRTGIAGGIIALVLGMLAKYLPLILVPAQLVYGWRTRRSWYSFILQAAVGIVVGLIVAVLLYRSFWIGPATFRGVREQGKQTFYASTPVVLYSYFHRTHSDEDASRLASGVADVIFGLYVLWASLRVRDADTLLKACAGIALVFLLVASPTYWPWYATLPLALMALSPHGAMSTMIILLTFCSRLTGPIDDMSVNGFTNWNVEVWSTTAIALALPLVVFVVLSAWQWRRPRPAPFTPART
jgi:alpha-1,6-mannosyltransferase